MCGGEEQRHDIVSIPITAQLRTESSKSNQKWIMCAMSYHRLMMVGSIDTCLCDVIVSHITENLDVAADLEFVVSHITSCQPDDHS